MSWGTDGWEETVADERWLVVGLGNPQSEYGDTRHNIGADVVRAFARREHAELRRNKRVRCEIADVTVDGVRFVLALPLTYMNRSGDPTRSAAGWFKVPLERIVVCHDDLDLPLGAIRLKRGGGNAGHNGLNDVDRALGTPEYLRVRLGIGRPPGRMPARDFVLRRFSPSERDEVDVSVEDAVDAIVSIVSDGLPAAQNRFHGRSRHTGGGS